jgi:hypothetical protein
MQQAREWTKQQEVIVYYVPEHLLSMEGKKAEAGKRASTLTMK